MPALGIAIDQRRGAWGSVSEVITSLIHQPPFIDVDFILDWFDSLDVSSVSKRALALRHYWEKRTRQALMETDISCLMEEHVVA